MKDVAARTLLNLGHEVAVSDLYAVGSTPSGTWTTAATVVTVSADSLFLTITSSRTVERPLQPFSCL